MLSGRHVQSLLLGGRSMNNVPPPRSGFGLIQEDLWPSSWMIIVVGILLNQTRRKQVEKILPDFMKRWPTPEAFLQASFDDVATLCRSLGFANRRTKNLFNMTQKYVNGSWNNVRELDGVGEYCARSYEIFCLGMLGSEKPKDHALEKYWLWRQKRSTIENQKYPS